jgi:two-component system nitrate/nitrite response regulator NarL
MAIKVLILEDNPVTRGFLCRVVRESFSDVDQITEASDLDAARRALGHATAGRDVPHGEPFQMILVDLELPDGSGLDLLSELDQYPATRIVTTLYSDDEQLFPALQRGADGYLLKEDRFEVLVEELQKIVRGQPPLSPAIARKLLSHFRSGSPVPLLSASEEGGASDQEHGRLASRENEVLTYLSKGFTIKEIAALMGIKWFTVNDHIKSIYKKLSVSSRV